MSQNDDDIETRVNLVGEDFQGVETVVMDQQQELQTLIDT